jgi:pyruvate/2-oxoglutarate dehydrogenase complex dihydrolipoamide dehydrogenase (E3) component
MTESFDAIVVGAGQAGPSLAVRLAGAGRKVALVERNRLGGTCVNTGCIPTKALVASARAAWVARNAARYGVVLGDGGAGDRGVRVDMRAVKARKDQVVQGSRDGLTKWIGATRGLTYIEGHARFTGERQLQVGAGAAARTLHAPLVVLNVGGRPAVPPIKGIESVPHFTSSSMMHVDFLPPHLIVIGGSYIGLEFAQMYRRFGSRVTVIELAPRIVPREDPDISDGIRAALEADGVEFRTSATCLAVRAEGSGEAQRIVAGVDCTAGSPEVVGTHLLVATGRRPNTDDLDLGQTGLATDAQGYIEVDDALQSRVAGIFVLGDANRRGAFTHTSYNDYEIVAANLLDGAARRVSERVPAYALYVDPPLGRVGITEAQARASGRPVLAAQMPMTRVGRARERGETLGQMKVLVDGQTRRLLGASLFGIEADEVVHVFVLAMNAGLTVDQIQRAVPIHPTVAELLPTLLEGLKPLKD